MGLWPRKWWKRIALVVVLLIVGGAVWLFALRVWSSARFEAELRAVLAETDQADPGWRWEELEAARPQVPDEENAALVAAGLANLWGKHRDAGARFADFTGRLAQVPPNCRFPEDLAEDARQILEELGPELERARALEKTPRGHYPLRLTPDVISTTMPQFSGYRHVITLLSLDLWVRLHDGDRAAAWERLRGMMNCSRAAEGEPILIAHLVRCAFAHLTVQAAERWVGLDAPPHAEGGPDRLRELLRFFEEQRSGFRLPEALRSERAYYNVLFGNLESGKVSLREVNSVLNLPVFWTKLGDFTLAPLVLHNHAVYLRRMNEAIEIARLPHEEQTRRWEDWDARLKTDNSVKTRLASYLLPAVSKVVEAEQRTVALLDCARCGIACELFRMERGRWPDALNELIPDYLPEVPSDPYDGRPLRLRRLEDGVVSYSVGPNREDDAGGELWRSGKPGPGADVGFRLWDPKQRRRPPPEPKPEPPNDLQAPRPGPEKNEPPGP